MEYLRANLKNLGDREDLSVLVNKVMNFKKINHIFISKTEIKIDVADCYQAETLWLQRHLLPCLTISVNNVLFDTEAAWPKESQKSESLSVRRHQI